MTKQKKSKGNQCKNFLFEKFGNDNDDFTLDDNFARESCVLELESYNHQDSSTDSKSFIHNKSRRVVNRSQIQNIEYLHCSNVKIPWKMIHLIELAVEHDISCPICLETPMIPRILECGHIFCLFCMANYCVHLKKNQSCSTIEAPGTQASIPEKLQYECPICKTVFLPHEMKMCQFSLIISKYSEIKNQFQEFSLMRQAKSFSVVAPKENFSKQLLFTHSLSGLKKHGANSNYATMYDNQFLKMISEDRHILLTYFETLDPEENEETFVFAFSHLESYENDIRENVYYDILHQISNKVSLPPNNDDENDLDLFDFYYSIEHPDMYLSSLSHEMVCDSFKQFEEEIPAKLVVCILFISSYTKGVQGCIPELYKNILNAKTNGSMIKLAFANPNYLELNSELLEKYGEKIKQLSTKANKEIQLPKECKSLQRTSSQESLPPIEEPTQVKHDPLVEKLTTLSLDDKKKLFASSYASMARCSFSNSEDDK